VESTIPAASGEGAFQRRTTQWFFAKNAVWKATIAIPSTIFEVLNPIHS
jgi:hypothetical protein